MNEIRFVDKVKRHFGFLEAEYGFKLTHQSNSDGRPQTDGIVEYASDTTVVVIDSETGSAAVWFYRIKDGRSYDLDPVAIHEYLSTTDKEKEILLSTDPNDHSVALDLFNKRFLLNQPDWKESTDTVESRLETRLARYANWLKANAELVLESDFSLWPKFYEYKVNRARADHLRRRKDEFGYVHIKGNDGIGKLVKQSIFKDKLNHVEKLKEEFQDK